MNILPKKRWHVRTKENVARVRRDQKLAREKEETERERALIAEREFKLNILRKNAEDRLQRTYGGAELVDRLERKCATLENAGGHVNLFLELEEEERKNIGVRNKEYEEEKRKEKEEYEKKIGILQYLGQGSNEVAKESMWYEKLPANRSTISKIQNSTVCKNSANSMCNKKDFDEVCTKKVAKDGSHSSRSLQYIKKRRKTHSSDEEVDEDQLKMVRLEELRRERIKREEIEKKRTADLLNPDTNSCATKKSNIVRKYNSQFNPELARQNRF